MEWEPAKSDDVVNVAWPETRLLVASGVVPSLKVTVPVGVPLPGATALTVAVNVTEVLTTEGLSDEVTVFVVLGLMTVCVTVKGVLLLKLPSPLSAAVIKWEPTERVVLVYRTTPAASVLVSSGVPSTLKVTVPVGVPAPGDTALTVAAK